MKTYIPAKHAAFWQAKATQRMVLFTMLQALDLKLRHIDPTNYI